VVPAYHHLVKVSEPAMITAAKDELLKALACVDEFLALHGAGDGDYAVGPHYGWSMSSQGGDDKVRWGGRVVRVWCESLIAPSGEELCAVAVAAYTSAGL
jgi:hypothetical protein